MKWSIGKLNVLERISLFATITYCLGIAVLMQFGAVNFRSDVSDWPRLKPMMVGIIYLIYLAIPMVVVFVPFVIARLSSRRYFRPFLFLIALILVVQSLALACHYFLPFTYYDLTSDMGVLKRMWIILGRFWRMYLDDGCQFAVFSLMAFSLAGILIRMYGKLRIVRSLPVSLFAVVFMVCVVMNIYAFNLNVYCNVSQGVFGGAPRAGILTVANPTEELKREYCDMPSVGNELSFPCLLLDSTPEYLTVCKLKRMHYDFGGFTTKGMPVVAVTVRRGDVVQFVPLSLCPMVRDGKYYLIDNMEKDPVFRMDFKLGIRLVSTNGVYQCFSVDDVLTEWNNASLRWNVDGRFSVEAREPTVDMCQDDGTNVFLSLQFPALKILGALWIPQVKDILANEITHVEFCVAGCPTIKPPYKVEQVAAAVYCNYFQEIDLPYKVTKQNGQGLVFQK